MTFGVMLHHFHDDRVHRRGQGSISADTFERLLDRLCERFDVLSAEDYLERALAGSLGEADVCITLDDALRCQYDIARPALDGRGIGAFFFIYSNIFTDRPDLLEIYRDFRQTCFDDVEHFYRVFFAELTRLMPDRQARYLDTYPSDYLADYPFYTDGDRRFRFVRDRILGEEEYAALMEGMMSSVDYPLEQRRGELWMTAEQVAELSAGRHLVGLHSHSHPMQMGELSRECQAREFRRNHQMLSAICGSPPLTMSHPCGSYSGDTLSVLEEMGIRLGFRSNMSGAHGGSLLEIPREDHVNLIDID